MISIFSWQEAKSRFGTPLSPCHCEGYNDTYCVALVINKNGTKTHRIQCIACGVCRGDQLSQQLLPWEQPAAVINLIKTDNYGQPRIAKTCERCGQWECGVEFHHWAPRAIFEDADHWPGSWLCKSCHNEWHKKMNGGADANG
jgi:hypothetical protein